MNENGDYYLLSLLLSVCFLIWCFSKVLNFLGKKTGTWLFFSTFILACGLFISPFVICIGALFLIICLIYMATKDYTHHCRYYIYRNYKQRHKENKYDLKIFDNKNIK